MTSTTQRLPAWLRNPVSKNVAHKTMRSKLASDLHTVCESALCPNRGECFSSGTVTFMILGNTCTRNCTFCAVDNNRKSACSALDPDEPNQVAKAAVDLKLKHIVITSVTRDDLPDQGASQFAKTIEAVRTLLPDSTIEVLTPDFNGREDLLDIVLSQRPTVFNHNVETVPRLYPQIRPQADYRQSLGVLQYANDYQESTGLGGHAGGGHAGGGHIGPPLRTKSGFMLGLGETRDEVVQVLEDLKAVGTDLVTIGQYIAPSRRHTAVVEYVHPDQFAEYKQIGEQLGIPFVFSGPLVRSSYHAGEVFQ